VQTSLTGGGEYEGPHGIKTFRGKRQQVLEFAGAGMVVHGLLGGPCNALSAGRRHRVERPTTTLCFVRDNSRHYACIVTSKGKGKGFPILDTERWARS